MHLLLRTLNFELLLVSHIHTMPRKYVERKPSVIFETSNHKVDLSQYKLRAERHPSHSLPQTPSSPTRLLVNNNKPLTLVDLRTYIKRVITYEI